MADQFVRKTIDEQESTRIDIRSLADEMNAVRAAVLANSELLERLCELAQEQNEREAKLVKIAEDVTVIAHSVTETMKGSVLLIENLYRKNQILTELLEDSLKRIKGYTAMNGLIDRLDASGRESNHGLE